MRYSISLNFKYLWMKTNWAKKISIEKDGNLKLLRTLHIPKIFWPQKKNRGLFEFDRVSLCEH